MKLVEVSNNLPCVPLGRAFDAAASTSHRTATLFLRKVGRVWLIASVLKTDRGNTHGGSNPSLSAILSLGSLAYKTSVEGRRKEVTTEDAGENPARATISASVAQLVEPLLSKKHVVRSIRTRCSSLEAVNRAQCKRIGEKADCTSKPATRGSKPPVAGTPFSARGFSVTQARRGSAATDGVQFPKPLHQISLSPIAPIPRRTQPTPSPVHKLTVLSRRVEPDEIPGVAPQRPEATCNKKQSDHGNSLAAGVNPQLPVRPVKHEVNPHRKPSDLLYPGTHAGWRQSARNSHDRWCSLT